MSEARAWSWPVDGPVLRSFSFDHAHPYAGGQHRGVDLGAPAGSPVLAPAQGVVSFAGTVPTGGKTVSIETPYGYTTTLVHLGSIEVRRGAPVAEGSLVGTVGPSGVPELTEPYVYFGLRTTGDPQGYVDPVAFLPAHTFSPPATTAEAPAVVAVASDASPAAAPAAE
ncbi:MAG: M23 family metallopeptidase, partial [Actinobacteria bacterium]|nr:M23 family metallopeptidase [Actinomycetota bacterium]